MSIVYEDEFGYLISHKNYIDSLYNFNKRSYNLHPNLFNISSPYKPSSKTKKIRKLNEDHYKYEDLRNEIHEIKSRFYKFIENIYLNGALKKSDFLDENILALEMAEYVYNESSKNIVKNALGSNIGPATIKTISGVNYLFPANSSFYSKDICDIHEHLEGFSYDLVVLDPPWWNKYIRRKRKKFSDGYNMLTNDKLKNLPIEKLLKDNGLLVVWCTNSEQHLNYLLTDIFSMWNVKFLCKWYWLKVTSSGVPICNFNDPPGKQPYEKIIFASRNPRSTFPRTSKLVVSVPSALHSHKPPLSELVKYFFTEQPICLEIFARYLLPGWTSYGNEVLRFQHESLFEVNEIE